MKLRRDKPLVTQVNSFESAEKACCACFKSKYAWPANAGRGAAFAPKQTCDTCYVADIYGTDSKAPLIIDVPRPGATDPALKPGCQNLCDQKVAPKFCGYKHVEPGTGKETFVEYTGKGACDKYVADPFFVQMVTRGQGSVCDFAQMQKACPLACKLPQCIKADAADVAYEKTSQSKVTEIHEWNWNCAGGDAPEDGGKWLTGQVEGEPESTRAPFLMCKEDDGWSCPSADDADDLVLKVGEKEPTKVNLPNGSAESVATMSLPVIDGAASVAASASR